MNDRSTSTLAWILGIIICIGLSGFAAAGPPTAAPGSITGGSFGGGLYTLVFLLLLGFVFLGGMIVLAILVSLTQQPNQKVADFRLRQDIERRKKYAEQSGIGERAKFVLDTLGEKSSFTAGAFNVTRTGNLFVVRILQGEAWGAVFEAELTPGSSYATHEWASVPDGEGRKRFVRSTDWSETPDRYAVSCYIPGPWEKYLHDVHNFAKERRKADESRWNKLALEQERKKFGL